MCGRFTLTASGEELAEAFGLDEAPGLAPRYNIAPTQPVLVVRALPSSSRREAVSLAWGFAGADTEGGRLPLVINARSETVSRRSAFREAFRARRCLVPADGFYEWIRGQGRAQPYHFRFEDRRVFAFAGLWDPPPEGGGAAGACVILTTEPSDVVRPIHDRMPVIVPPSAYELWLDPRRASAAETEALLRPFGGEGLLAEAVEDAVNDVRVDSPACLVPRRTLFS
jgi:putative SOS response-associated peptidase YedK